MSKEHVHGVFETIAKNYDSANDRISLGMHRVWKKALVGEVLKPANEGAQLSGVGFVLDVCCGTGDVVQMAAKASPSTLVCGLDFSESMLSVAKCRTSELNNVVLTQGNAMQLPFDSGMFDAASISFGLRNTPDYFQVLSEMKRVTRAGGVVACLDASVVDDPLIHPFYEFYYKHIMTFLGGGLSRHKEYEWLYQSTEDFLRKHELAALFSEVGLKNVRIKPFMMGAAALHVGTVG